MQTIHNSRSSKTTWSKQKEFDQSNNVFLKRS